MSEENYVAQEASAPFGIGHILRENSPNCPNPECNSSPSKHEVRDYSLLWQDGNVHCTLCGTFVRDYDAG